jgi:rieske iron-sulfur protein
MADDRPRPKSESTETGPDRTRVNRRHVLGTTVAVGLGVAGLSAFAAAVRLVPRIVVASDQEPPVQGDLLVFAQGARLGQVLTVNDVQRDAPQVFAWPMDPGSKVVKSGDIHNLTLLVRAGNVNWFTTDEKPHTFQNVAAYSAVCPHLCCTVSDWRTEPAAGAAQGVLLCPCHLTRFDPWAGGRVLGGPSPRPLPILPLMSDPQDRLVVAGGFLTQVGCAT